MYLKFDKKLIEQQCKEHLKFQSENYINQFKYTYGAKNTHKIHNRFSEIITKMNNIYPYIKKLCENMNRAHNLYYNNNNISDKPIPELWLLKQTEMRDIYEKQYINACDKNPEQKYMKWMYDNFPENMDKHIKNYDNFGLPLDICEIFYDLSTIKTHHI